MFSWQKIWESIGRVLGINRPERLSFKLDQRLIASLEKFAEIEDRHPEEVASDLITFAIAQRKSDKEYIQIWEELTPRQQQVTALTCLNYTNRQMAAALKISPETVKSHIRGALQKFNVNSKSELSQMLKEWDFSDWPDKLS